MHIFENHTNISYLDVSTTQPPYHLQDNKTTTTSGLRLGQNIQHQMFSILCPETTLLEKHILGWQDV